MGRSVSNTIKFQISIELVEYKENLTLICCTTASVILAHIIFGSKESSDGELSPYLLMLVFNHTILNLQNLTINKFTKNKVHT